MNTHQINNIMKSCSYGKNHFHGVYAADEIPFLSLQPEIYPQAFIFNYDPSYMPGSHWVAVILNKNKRHIFFDSYGRPPGIVEIKHFLNGHYNYNHVQYQHPLSSTCGQWCIFYLWYYFTKPHIPLTEKFNSNDTLTNDNLVNTWVNETFHTHLHVLDKKHIVTQFAKQFNVNMKNKDFPLYSLET